MNNLIRFKKLSFSIVKTIFTFIIMCSSFGLLFSQVIDSTILGSLHQNDNFSFNCDLVCVGDFYYFISQQSTSGAYIMITKTDKNFHQINRIDTLKAFGEIQFSAYFIYVNETKGYALLSTSSAKRIGLMCIIKLDLASLKVVKEDSIRLNKDENYLRWGGFRHNTDSTLINIGYIINRVNYKVVDDCFMEVSTNGDIKEFQRLKVKNPLRVLSWFYVDKINSYLVNGVFHDDFIVLDKNLDVKQRIPNLYYHKAYGTIWDDIFKIPYCMVEDSFVHCICESIYDRNYAVSHIRFPIIGDSLGKIDTIVPLCEKDIRTIPEFLNYAIDDSTGDAYFVLDDEFSFYTPPLRIDTTTLYILKTNYYKYHFNKNEWFVSFSDGNEYSAWAAALDDNDNFIIIGGFWTNDYPNKTNNFYLKVRSDGTITATKGVQPEDIMVVYPNPTSGELHLLSGERNFGAYQVYNLQGQLVKQDKVSIGKNFNITGLPSGTYFIHFQDKNGHKLGTAKVVKY